MEIPYQRTECMTLEKTEVEVIKHFMGQNRGISVPL
jgi:hypothetical protein